ncbi:transglycosylase domain-containing protein [Clostridium saccharobutylicum]|uniref:Penicillin-binding protein 1A n=2 Tax=Clostridium saccharobutylicum TaxID=169679 RepID=U5MNP4_CLOSA|nr:PBP1A family penicillin-binding protein [Clostridium saccharobutylicum]AGX42143.1 penicillin-binding protein 1A [Clostridium saccharobutylicum DSM 13864]AQR89423.1 penicillin-binding protein 1F [Clostridium saccharobutylicum]AQR99325.1 penicillin-binding protein 1F [Clostridium saccharobutylicum]AQS13311.1 penicillin-binding protein 1F [Clostridium saccharobutylicum]MBA2904500.1 penicillin-binding protein 1A [Clostridium saccharobutylicum]
MAVNNNAKKTNVTPRKKKKPKQKKSKKIFRGIIFGLLFCFLAIFVVGAGYAFAIIKTTPPLDVKAVLSLNQASSVYDSKEDFIDNLQTDEERYVIDSSKMPTKLKNAFVSIEDERFYSHKGIDIQRILGSALLDARRLLTGQKGLHGASTLTQQLLKNTILTNDISIERKVKEIYLAINLEQKLTKDQILTAYLNTIPMGGHAYGVEAASQLYFSKSASDLSLIECAYLAGITQAPSYYSAYNENNQKDSTPYITRTLTVLEMMHKLQYISDPEYTKAVSDVKGGKLVFKQTKKDYKLNYEWFVYPAVSQVKEDLKEKYKYTDEEASKLMVNGGLKIYTTMDRQLQDYTQATLDNYKNLGVSNGETYDKDGVPLLQASATIMDYRNGHIIAMVGGRGKQKPQSTNRAYNDLRPIGSSTKPLTVYGPGIDQKIITAASPIDDAPIPEEIGKKYSANEPYNPLNSPNQYSGLISAREALTHSKNTAAVLTEDKIGLKTGISYGEKLGLKYNSASKSSIAALSLGQFNNDPNDRDGGNTYTLAGAYATFGNSGMYTKPILYTKVVDSNGKVILDNTKPNQTKVFSPQTAYILYDMLKGPVNEYNATGAKWGDMPVAGKTGTTSNSTDLWFAGLSPYLSGSVWIGYDKPTKLMGSSSGCASLWGKIMAKAHEGMDAKDIEEPTGITKVDVCKDSGDLPGSLCNRDPRGNRITEELFIDGTEPTTTCTTHVSSRGGVYIKKDHPNPVTEDYSVVLGGSGSGQTTSNFTNKWNSIFHNKSTPANNSNNSNSNESDSQSQSEDTNTNTNTNTNNSGKNETIINNNKNSHNSMGPGDTGPSPSQNNTTIMPMN